MPTKIPGMLIHPAEEPRQRIDDICEQLGISRTQLINQLFGNDKNISETIFLRIVKHRNEALDQARANVAAMKAGQLPGQTQLKPW